MADDRDYIRFACGFCSKFLKAPPAYAGRRVTCNGCGNKIRVPSAYSAYEESFFEPDEETVPALTSPPRQERAPAKPVAPVVVKDKSTYRGCVSSAFLWAALLWSIFTMVGCFMHIASVARRVNDDIIPSNDLGITVLIVIGLWGAIWFFPWLGAVVFAFVTKKN